jgi:broad specificity phosphatase PhoE
MVDRGLIGAYVGKLILVRHGKTIFNSLDAEERLRGWMDISLDEQGLREADETAQRIAQHAIAQVQSSDLYRARQTADAMVKATRAPIVHTSDLRPWNVGTLAGQRVKDILPILERLERNPALPAPGGESFLQFCDRYLQKLKELIDLAARSTDCIVAVTHVRNLLATPTLLHGGDRSRIPVRGGPKTGSLVWIERKGTGWNIRVDEAAPPETRTSRSRARLRCNALCDPEEVLQRPRGFPGISQKVHNSMRLENGAAE